MTGDIVEDNSLALFGDALNGVISVHNYQVGLANPENEAFVKGYKAAYGANAIPEFPRRGGV